MRSVSVITLLAMLAAPAIAGAMQSKSPSAAEAAKSFSLDLPSPSATDAPVMSDAPPPSTIPAAVPEAAPADAYTLDTPIAQLVADPRSKAVLDQDLPGMSDDPNIAKFRTSSLRQLQPMTGGQLTDALLAKTATDLAAIGGQPAAASPPPVEAPTHNKRIDAGR